MVFVSARALCSVARPFLYSASLRGSRAGRMSMVTGQVGSPLNNFRQFYPSVHRVTSFIWPVSLVTFIDSVVTDLIRQSISKNFCLAKHICFLDFQQFLQQALSLSALSVCLSVSVSLCDLLVFPTVSASVRMRTHVCVFLCRRAYACMCVLGVEVVVVVDGKESIACDSTMHDPKHYASLRWNTVM